MNLIPNWRRCWRMFSVQALAIVGGIQSFLVAMPIERAMQPAPFLSGPTWADVGFYLSIVVAALGVVGRVIDQGQVTETQS